MNNDADVEAFGGQASGTTSPPERLERRSRTRSAPKTKKQFKKALAQLQVKTQQPAISGQELRLSMTDLQPCTLSLADARTAILTGGDCSTDSNWANGASVASLDSYQLSMASCTAKKGREDS